ncbi:MAG: hypothetical protein IT373_06220 [Polyangiaceae bacterium]|nr:hypothetical protein [Polyangiaceae bacterium]
MKHALTWRLLGLAVACGSAACGSPVAPGGGPSAASQPSAPLAPPSAASSASAGLPSAASSAPPGAGPEVDPFGPPSTGLRPCAVKGYVAPAGARLELVTRVRGTRLAVGLHNVGTAPVCVYSHVATHELQHDWLSVGYVDGTKPVNVQFTDSRDKSAAVSVEIAPGATSWVSFDLAAWKARPIHGGGALPKGRLELSVAYDTTRETWVWAGRLAAQTAMDVP